MSTVVLYRLDNHAWPHSPGLLWLVGLTFLGALGFAAFEGRVRRRRAEFAALADQQRPTERLRRRVSAARVGRAVVVGRINNVAWYLAAFAVLADLLGTLAVGYFHPQTTTPDRVGLGLLLGGCAGFALVLAPSKVVAVGPDLLADCSSSGAACPGATSIASATPTAPSWCCETAASWTSVGPRRSIRASSETC